MDRESFFWYWFPVCGERRYRNLRTQDRPSLGLHFRVTLWVIMLSLEVEKWLMLIVMEILQDCRPFRVEWFLLIAQRFSVESSHPLPRPSCACTLPVAHLPRGKEVALTFEPLPGCQTCSIAASVFLDVPASDGGSVRQQRYLQRRSTSSSAFHTDFLTCLLIAWILSLSIVPRISLNSSSCFLSFSLRFS